MTARTAQNALRAACAAGCAFALLLATSIHAQDSPAAASIEIKKPDTSAKKPSAKKTPAKSAKSTKAAPRTAAKTAPIPRHPLLVDKINAILEAADAAEQSHIGIHVVDLRTGKALYDQDATKLFAPASTTKLFTTALALSRLGPQYKFFTRITAAAYPNRDGVLTGDLIFEGGGDPSLSDRIYPYVPEEGHGRAAIEDFADQIAAHGIKRIEGDIAGDDTLYPWHPYPPGWTIDDAVADYGAPVSALSVYDNILHIGIHPGAKPGDLALVSISPPVEYYVIDNRVETTAGAGSVRLTRAPGSRQILLSGKIPLHGGIVENVAIDDPALFAAQALYDALTRRGISINGSAVARHRSAVVEKLPFDGVVLARRESPPLADLLQVVDKVSQNLHAEIMLREVGRARRNAATRTAGLDELRAFLVEQGIEGIHYDFSDGSGLSRLTMVAPAAQTKLLAKMYASKYRETWMKLLPIAGVDGTLKRRFKGEKLLVYAKTGSLSHVSALAGYAEHKTGMRAFSILVNQANYPAAEIRALVDKIVLAILED
jgi:D-alanyl-D-alanine carboxypeptidase/D-alanyl-D-alanine-endopeptidase (penicillin-binding protein 4)